jgi:DNA polymerase elongation subunit (family B)
MEDPIIRKPDKSYIRRLREIAKLDLVDDEVDRKRENFIKHITLEDFAFDDGTTTDKGGRDVSKVYNRLRKANEHNNLKRQVFAGQNFTEQDIKKRKFIGSVDRGLVAPISGAIISREDEYDTTLYPEYNPDDEERYTDGNDDGEHSTMYDPMDEDEMEHERPNDEGSDKDDMSDSESVSSHASLQPLNMDEDDNDNDALLSSSDQPKTKSKGGANKKKKKKRKQHHDFADEDLSDDTPRRGIIELYDKTPDYDYSVHQCERAKRKIDPDNENFKFYHLKSEYTVNKTHGLVLQQYGIWRGLKDPSDPSQGTVETSGCCNIVGFEPHMFIDKLPHWNDTMIEEMLKELNRVLMEDFPWTVKDRGDLFRFKKFITGFSVKGCSELFVYGAGDISQYVDIRVAHPRIIPALRSLLEYPCGSIKTYYGPNKEDKGKNVKNKGSSNSNSKGNVAAGGVPSTPAASTKTPDNGGSTENTFDASWTPGKRLPSWNYAHYGIKCAGFGLRTSNIKLFEADVDWTIRYFVDNNYFPCTWYSVDAGKYRVVNSFDERETDCEFEIVAHVKDVLPRPAIENKDIPKLKRFTYDLEVETPRGQFPHASKDKIVAISIRSSVMGYKRGKSIVMILGHVSDQVDENCYTYWYATEKDMLDAFMKLVRMMDPDIISGYNINVFDFPYLMTRCKLNNVRNATFFGRTHKKEMYMTPNVSKGVYKMNVGIPGRIVYDVIRRVQMEEKFKSNTLGYVCQETLKDKDGNPVTKVDFDVALMNIFMKSEKGRLRIRKYVLKDAELPDLFGDAKKYFFTYMIGARTGAPLQACLDRAQAAKIESKVRRESYNNKLSDGTILHLLIVTRAKVKARDEEKYEGATVITPKPGYYGLGSKDNPGCVLVYDAQSLYPSIMRFRNLCFSTFVTPEVMKKKGLKESDVTRLPKRTFYDDRVEEEFDPNGPMFVTEEVMEGLLPRMQREDGDERARIRGPVQKEIVSRINMVKEMLDEFRSRHARFVSIHRTERLQFITEVASGVGMLTAYDALKADRCSKATNERLKLTKEPTDYVKFMKDSVLGPLEFFHLNGRPAEDVMPEAEVWYASVLIKFGVLLDELEFEYDLTEGEQGAIKLRMNSIYGLTGDSTNPFFLKQIATTVTATGRWIINMTKWFIQKLITKLLGFPCNAIVCYGDTDSVFVYLRDVSVPDGFSIGKYIQKELNKYWAWTKHIVFNFEKVYESWNLVSAKQYTGNIYMPVEDEKVFAAKMDTKGLGHKKRGPCNFTVKTATKFNDIIIAEKDIEGACEYARSQFNKLIKGDVNVGDLVECKKLSKPVDSYGIVDDNSTSESSDGNNDMDAKIKSLGPAVTLARRQTMVMASDLLSDFIKGKRHVCRLNSVKRHADKYVLLNVKMLGYDHNKPPDEATMKRFLGKEWSYVKYPVNPETKLVYTREDGTVDLKITSQDAVMNEESPVKAGDYVEYVVVQSDEKDPSVSDHVDIPLNVMRNKIPVDVRYYIESTMKKMRKLISGPLGYGYWDGIDESMKLKRKVTEDGNKQKISFDLKPEQIQSINRVLLGAKNVKSMHIQTKMLSTSAMSTYVVQKPTCIWCRSVIDDNNRLLYPEDLEFVLNAKKRELTELNTIIEKDEQRRIRAAEQEEQELRDLIENGEDASKKKKNRGSNKKRGSSSSSSKKTLDLSVTREITINNMKKRAELLSEEIESGSVTENLTLCTTVPKTSPLSKRICRSCVDFLPLIIMEENNKYQKCIEKKKECMDTCKNCLVMDDDDEEADSIIEGCIRTLCPTWSKRGEADIETKEQREMIKLLEF